MDVGSVAGEDSGPDSIIGAVLAGGSEDEAATVQACRHRKSSGEAGPRKTWRLSVSQGLLWNDEEEPRSTGSSHDLPGLPVTHSTRPGYEMLLALPPAHGAAAHEGGTATSYVPDSASRSSSLGGSSAKDVECGGSHGLSSPPQWGPGPCTEGLQGGSAQSKLLAAVGRCRLLSNRDQATRPQPACIPGSCRPTSGTFSSTGRSSSYHQSNKAQSSSLGPAAPDQQVCATGEGSAQAPHERAMNKVANVATAEEDVQRLLRAAAGTILLDLAQRHSAGGAGAHAPSHADGASAVESAQPRLTAKGTEPGSAVGCFTAVETWNREAGRGGAVDAEVWARRCRRPPRRNVTHQKLLSSATVQITALTVELLRMQQDVLELSTACLKVVNVAKKLISRVCGG